MNQTKIKCDNKCMRCRYGQHGLCEGNCSCMKGTIYLKPREEGSSELEYNEVEIPEISQNASCGSCLKISSCELYRTMAQMMKNYGANYDGEVNLGLKEGEKPLFDIRVLAQTCIHYFPPDMPVFTATAKADVNKLK